MLAFYGTSLGFVPRTVLATGDTAVLAGRVVVFSRSWNFGINQCTISCFYQNSSYFMCVSAYLPIPAPRPTWVISKHRTDTGGNASVKRLCTDDKFICRTLRVPIVRYLALLYRTDVIAGHLAMKLGSRLLLLVCLSRLGSYNGGHRFSSKVIIGNCLLVAVCSSHWEERFGGGALTYFFCLTATGSVIFCPKNLIRAWRTTCLWVFSPSCHTWVRCVMCWNGLTLRGLSWMSCRLLLFPAREKNGYVCNTLPLIPASSLSGSLYTTSLALFCFWAGKKLKSLPVRMRNNQRFFSRFQSDGLRSLNRLVVLLSWQHRTFRTVPPRCTFDLQSMLSRTSLSQNTAS